MALPSDIFCFSLSTLAWGTIKLLSKKPFEVSLSSSSNIKISRSLYCTIRVIRMTLFNALPFPILHFPYPFLLRTKQELAKKVPEMVASSNDDHIFTKI